MSSPSKILKTQKAARCDRAAGRLFQLFPGNSAQESARRDMCGHLHYFTKDIVLHIFEDLRYWVSDYFYTPRSIELAEEPIQKVLKLPRKVFFRLHQDLAVRVLGGFRSKSELRACPSTFFTV